MVALSLLPAGGQEVPTNRPKSDRIDVRAAHSIALPTDGKTACEQQADLQLKGALMPKLRVHSFAISVDGYGAGPDQDLANPLGVGGGALHEWAFATRTFRRMFGQDGGTTGADDDFAARGFKNIGAWILGRNMFGPIRGSWPDGNWKGWWGDNPPYHTP